MSQSDLSLEAEHLTNLFDAVLEFDKSVTLKLLRDKAARFKATEVRRLFQGYRPNTIPESTFIERFHKLARQHGHHAYRLIDLSFFEEFFAPSVTLFESVYASDFASSAELKAKRSLALASIQSGWPADLLQKILSLTSRGPDKFQALLAHLSSTDIDDLSDTQLSFLSNLTKDAVVAWRSNFSYNLEELLRHNRYDKRIEEALVAKDQAGLADLFLERLADEKWYERYSRELPINLILLAIDLRMPSYISKGIQGADRILAEELSDHVVDIRILSTLALGCAFIGNYDDGLGYIQKISQRDQTDPEVSGFIASILACSGRMEESAVMFFNSFRYRRSPYTWPLHALSDLGYLSTHLQEFAFSGGTTEAKINADAGSQIVQRILQEHPSWKSGPEGIYFSKSSPKSQIDSQQPIEDKPIEEHLEGRSTEPELAVLVEHHARITILEADLTQAQNSRSWGTVKDIATDLDETWNTVTKEIHTLITRHSSIIGPVDVEALQDERKDPTHLKQVILLLDNLIRRGKSRETELFESEKQTFLSRLRESKLEHYWPSDGLSRQEFDSLCEAVRPQLFKLETVRDIQSGALSASAFVRNICDVDERLSIIDELLSGLTLGNIGFSDVIANFIVLYPWDADYAARALDASMSAAKAEVGTSPVIETVITVVLRLAELLGHDPLEYLLSDSKLAESLVAALRDDHQPTLDLLRKMVTANDSDLTSRLRGIADRSEDGQYVSGFLASWLKTEPSIEPSARVKILSRWLRPVVTADATHADPWKELQMFIQLRDALVDDGRAGEATLLVSTVWRSSSDDRIFEGFERSFYAVLMDLLARGGESRRLAHNILESPDWLIKQEFGVEMFLYLCHIGDFPDIVEQIQYRHFSTFDRAKKRCPVLVNEFFLNARFAERPTIAGVDAISDSDVMHALQSIEELEHDLKKPSCYKAWATASDYQAFFNNRIDSLKYEVLYGRYDDKRFYENLHSIMATEWIGDADSYLNSRARHPANELMEKYIQNQIQRLRLLWDLKTKARKKNLVAYLETRKQPLRERLLEERRRLHNIPAEVSKIFECIVETVI